jgi:hypothetical protein
MNAVEIRKDISNCSERNKILIVQLAYWHPCLEISGEIAISMKEKGRDVSYLYISVDNPDTVLPKGIWPFQARLNRKLDPFLRILAANEINFKFIDGEYIDIENTFEFKNLDELKEIRFRDVNIGMGACSSMISLLANSSPDLGKNKALINRYLKSAAKVVEIMDGEISRILPDEIMVYNGRFCLEQAVSASARSRNARVNFFDAGSTFSTLNKYEIFEEQPHNMVYIRDRIKSLWDKANKHERESIADNFFCTRLKYQSGPYNFVENQKPGLIPLKTSRRRITYFTSSDDEYVAVGCMFKKIIFESQRDAIQFLIDYFSCIDDIEFIVRVHPHLKRKSNDEKEWWNSLKGSNLLLISQDSPIDSYALAKSSDAVVVFGSTIGIESTYMGLPVICISDSLYNGFGVAYEPKDKDELIRLLRQNLTPMPLVNTYPYGYYHSTFGIEFKYTERRSLEDGLFFGESLDVEFKFIMFAKKIVKRIIPMRILERLIVMFYRRNF